MKITFIYPNLMDRRSSGAMEPLVFAVLSGLTPSSVELELFDEHLEPIPKNLQTDLVAMTVGTYTARRAYQIANQFRKQGIPVIMGGYHPSFLPKEALTFADSVVIGDAEGIWEKIVQDAKRGKLKPVYRATKRPSLSGLKFDRSIFKNKPYKFVDPVQYGRGCRYACDFCSIHSFYGLKTRQRPLSEVVCEIETLDRKYIVFIDDNLFVDFPKAEELFRALIPLNIQWACQISLDITKNPQILDLMARSGCICVLIGFETIHEENLRQMKKGWNIKYTDYLTAIREFRNRGIMVYASLVFGYDYDTVRTFDETAEFFIRSKCALANINTLIPMPGSKLYSRLLNEGRLIYTRWWLDTNYRYGQATFHPLRMTADELMEGCMRVRKIFHGYGSIIQRAYDPLANSRNISNLGLFLALNMLARSELTYKLNHRLGANASLEPSIENDPIDKNYLEGYYVE